MRIPTHTFVIVLSCLGTLVVPLVTSVAHADPLSKPASQDARSHLSRGNKLYGVRSFEEAVVEYKAGAIIEPAPVFDYNLGQCFRQLGKYQDAMWHYERFIERANPQGELLGAVNSFLTQMRSELDKRAMTQKPTEAAPMLGRPAQTQQGEVHLDASRPVAWYQDTAGWGITATGVVGLGIGTALLIDASSLRNEANSTPFQQEQPRLLSKANTRGTAGVALSIGGGCLAVLGVIKLAINPREVASTTAWHIGIGGNGLLVSGYF